MALTPLTAANKNQSLNDLAVFIWGNEILLGQAVQIGSNPNGTVVVFDSGKPVPAANEGNLRVAVVPGTNSVPPGALAFLCQGKVFVGGVKGHVQVYRV